MTAPNSSIDWGRTNTFSDLKFHGNSAVNDVESKWTAMEEEELEESNFNWCICISRSIAIVLIVVIAVLMSLHKFFPRIYWLAGFITAFLICLLLASFLPFKYLKSHSISTFSLTNGLKEISGIGSKSNTPTHSESSIAISNTNKTTLQTKLLPIRTGSVS